VLSSVRNIGAGPLEDGPGGPPAGGASCCWSAGPSPVGGADGGPSRDCQPRGAALHSKEVQPVLAAPRFPLRMTDLWGFALVAPSH